MQLSRLGPMFDELQAVLRSKGCRMTEMSVTFYPLQDREMTVPESQRRQEEQESATSDEI